MLTPCGWKLSRQKSPRTCAIRRSLTRMGFSPEHDHEDTSPPLQDDRVLCRSRGLNVHLNFTSFFISHRDCDAALSLFFFFSFFPPLRNCDLLALALHFVQFCCTDPFVLHAIPKNTHHHSQSTSWESFGDEEHNVWNLVLEVLAHHRCSPVLQRGVCATKSYAKWLLFYFAGSCPYWQCSGGQSEKVAPIWSDKGHTKEGSLAQYYGQNTKTAIV